MPMPHAQHIYDVVRRSRCCFQFSSDQHFHMRVPTRTKTTDDWMVELFNSAPSYFSFLDGSINGFNLADGR